MTRIASINFLADTRAALLRLLAAGNFQVPANIGSDAESVVRIWANVRHRLLDDRKRTVQRSRGLANRVLPKAIARVVDEIIRRARNGEPLKPFLHRPLTRSPDYNDALLNEWGIYHFHLGGLTPEADGYMPRSSELLFAFAKGDDLYLLDVRDHRAFLDEDLVDVIRRKVPALARIDELHLRLDFDPDGKPLAIVETKSGYRFGLY